MTEKVRIKSLVEETRVAAVRAASASGHGASLHEVSEVDTEDDDDDQSDDVDETNDESIPLGLARIYKRTLEILGDSLIPDTLPEGEGSTSKTLEAEEP